MLGVGNARFLLHGNGPSVFLAEEVSDVLCGHVRVFERNTVHGIRTVASQTTEDGQFSAIFLVWGGQSLRIVRLNASSVSSTPRASLVTISAEYGAPDWILDINIYKEQTNPPLQSSSVVHLISAHNVLFGLDLDYDSSQSSASLRLYEITTGLKSVLYSANITWISQTQILVAAGTVFGEIVVWSCIFPLGLQNKSFVEHYVCIHHIFAGHEGSIFGVNFSTEIAHSNEDRKRYLASCSDDRTIRIWDVSDCISPYDNSDAKRFLNQRISRSTGFGDVTLNELDMNSENCIAKTWGHSSRIWGIYFLRVLQHDTKTTVKLVSRGEDATCQLWDLLLQHSSSQEGRPSWELEALENRSIFNYHSGKNIWSVGFSMLNNAARIYTGGADGRLMSFDVDIDNEMSSKRDIQLRLDNTDSISDGTDNRALDRVTCVPATAKKFKQRDKIIRFALVSEDCFVVTTSLGKVAWATVPKTHENLHNVHWNLVTTLEPLKAYSVISEQPDRRIAIIGDSKGGIWEYNHDKKSVTLLAHIGKKISGIFIVCSNSHNTGANDYSPLTLIVTSMDPSYSAFLLSRVNLESKSLVISGLTLPTDFMVTSTLYLRGNSYLALGSKTGDFALFRIGDSANTHPIMVLHVRRLHGDDAVTSITSLRSETIDQSGRETLITTGRDGYYSVHLLSGLDCPSLLPEIQTVHRSCPPFGPNIEGAYIDASTNNTILFGFQSTRFVVWNESVQTELTAVNCGGAHRAWVYQPSKGPDSRETLLWSQAGAPNLYSKTTQSHRTIRHGGHGREIKATAISHSFFHINGRKSRLLATGSEDTAIRLFAIDGSTAGSQSGRFRCLRTLKGHSAGIQELKWSSCGKYLFSSAGREEFYVWRVRQITGFGVGVVREGQCPINSPQSDLRIMGFDVAEITNNGSFLLSMAYSNSKVKVSKCPPHCVLMDTLLIFFLFLDIPLPVLSLRWFLRSPHYRPIQG